MPGQGKYSTYYNQVPESDKKQLLEKVFSTSPFIDSGYDQAVTVKTANKYLAAIGDSESGVPNLQVGDPGLFPNGVKLDFSGVPGSPYDTDVSKVKWQKGGDPATPYVPDIRSPGVAPGTVLSDNNTDTVTVNVDASNGDPRTTDPQITNSMIKPNYDPADAQGDIFENKGTVNPEFTGPRIHEVAAVSVTNPLKLGSAMKSAGES